MPLWMALHHIHVPSEMQGSFFKILQATFYHIAGPKCDRKAHVQNANRGRKCKSGTYLRLALLHEGDRPSPYRLVCSRRIPGGPLKMMRDPLKRVRGHRKRSCSQFYDREKSRQEPASSSKRFYGAVSLRASVHAEGTSPICKSASRRYVPEFACGRYVPDVHVLACSLRGHGHGGFFASAIRYIIPSVCF